MAILQIKGQTQGTGTITFTMPSTDEQSTVTLPAKSGTIALTSDIVETDVSTFATKTELSSGLSKKAEKIHTHAEADITGLTDKLGTFATTNALTSGLAGKANSTHSHTLQQITNLESTLSGKAPLANPTFTGTVTGTFKGNLTGNVTGNASSATKATQDASGNVITTTYATKAEMNAKAPLANPTFTGTVTISGGTFKGNLTGTADTANAVTWANVSGKPGLIPTSGNAGTISTSETIANLQTVSATSPRSMKATSGATVTLQQGGAEAWITVVACEGAVTVNLGDGWAWSGSAPTLGKGLITCAWYGSFGIVNFMKWGS